MEREHWHLSKNVEGEGEEAYFAHRGLKGSTCLSRECVCEKEMISSACLDFHGTSKMAVFCVLKAFFKHNHLFSGAGARGGFSKGTGHISLRMIVGSPEP